MNWDSEIALRNLLKSNGVGALFLDLTTLNRFSMQSFVNLAVSTILYPLPSRYFTKYKTEDDDSRTPF